MNMIEAGARALINAQYHDGAWDVQPEGPTKRLAREDARACWTAMVEGLTDEQALLVYARGYGFIVGDRAERAEVCRAALLELMEVEDG